MQMKRTLVAVVAALSLLAACGDDATKTAATTTTAAAEVPTHIMSLSATATEMLFAIGAGDQVVAVDSTSNYPTDAPITELSAYEPNIEAISGYEPDLVITDGTGDLDASLEKIGIEVLALPVATELQDTYDQLTQLGEVTGHVDEAAEVVSTMRADVKALLAEVPDGDAPLTFFHELDDTLYSVTSTTFIGSLYKLVGLENVADAADADGQSGGYPQLSVEYLVSTDPDLVFLADTKCCEQTAATFAARPGFKSLQAVTADQVVELDDDVASRWGPRVVDLLRQIVGAVKAVRKT